MGYPLEDRESTHGTRPLWVHAFGYRPVGLLTPPFPSRYLMTISTKTSYHGISGFKSLEFSPSEIHYSARSAFMGEIRAARMAGMMAAKNAQMASALAATVSANGSQLETP